jgi:hypothetical protein
MAQRIIVKHNLWECIRARRAWRWAMFIMHELCGVRSGNYDSFNLETNIVWGRFPKITAKRLKFSTSLGLLHFGSFGLNAMTMRSTMNNGTNLRSRIGFGMNSSFTPKWLRIGCLKKLRLAASPRRSCSKVLTKLGSLGMFFVGDTIYKLRAGLHYGGEVHRS